jgi:hypothetical protein
VPADHRFEGLNFDLTPRANFFSLGTFDTYRWVVSQPSYVDRVFDEYSEHLQNRQSCAGPVSIGLKNARNYPLAGQSCDGTVAVLSTQHFDSRGVTGLGRGPQTNIFRASFVRINQRCNSTRLYRLSFGPLCDLSSKYGLVRSCEFL